MVKFVAKERNPNEPCFIYEEEHEMIIDLKPPADLREAEELAKTLNDRIKKITYDPDSLPPTGGRG